MPALCGFMFQIRQIKFVLEMKLENGTLIGRYLVKLWLKWKGGVTHKQFWQRLFYQVSFYLNTKSTGPPLMPPFWTLKWKWISWVNLFYSKIAAYVLRSSGNLNIFQTGLFYLWIVNRSSFWITIRTRFCTLLLLPCWPPYRVIEAKS